MLIDKFGRYINYLRIAITDKCNFNCIYCTDNSCSKTDISLKEFFKVVKVATLLGIQKVRITGGEPLIKEEIIDFLKELKKLNLEIGITTNASLINEEYIKTFREVKIKKFNVSLDTLDKEKFKFITKKDALKIVLKNIKILSQISNEIKINTVVLKDINTDEFHQLINFATEHNLVLRFIEYLPVGENKKFYFSLNGIIEKLKIQYKFRKITTELGFGPGKYYKTDNTIIGFIPAISHPFCSFCNRLRITSSLTLRSCLGNSYELDLKYLSEKEIKEQFFLAVKNKPEKYMFETTFKDCMRKIGG